MSATADAWSHRAAEAERRIGRLTVWLGAAAAVVCALTVSWRFGVGVAAGTGLAWLNYRWLQDVLDAFVTVTTAQAGARRPRLSRWLYVKLFGRYALIGLAVYVMFRHLEIPLLSILCGLLSLGASAFVEGIYEAVSGSK